MSDAELDADRAKHLEVPAGDAAADDADGIDRLDKGLGAAVEDRHLGPVDLDEEVVDPEAAQARHQVFDGGDGATLAIADDGAELGRGDFEAARINQTILSARQAGAEENDAMISLGGVEVKIDRLA